MTLFEKRSNYFGSNYTNLFQAEIQRINSLGVYIKKGVSVVIGIDMQKIEVKGLKPLM